MVIIYQIYFYLFSFIFHFFVIFLILFILIFKIISLIRVIFFYLRWAILIFQFFLLFIIIRGTVLNRNEIIFITIFSSFEFRVLRFELWIFGSFVHTFSFIIIFFRFFWFFWNSQYGLLLKSFFLTWIMSNIDSFYVHSWLRSLFFWWNTDWRW